MIVVDIDGNVIEGDLKPSSDTASHLYIYQNRPDVGGIVHTHSRYATAFAAVGKSIPVYLTAQADEFGCEIPCAGFALIGSEDIGKQVVEHIGESPALLMKNHGVFTVGKDAVSAVKSAVMVEDIAATVWMALQIGTPDVIPPESVEKLHYRYIHIMDNKCFGANERRKNLMDLKKYEVWFITGSQHLYGQKTLDIVDKHSKKISDFLNASEYIP